MDFEILSDITDIQKIAVGTGIRDIAKLRRKYGRGRWRKVKGIATIRLRNGRVRVAELHWYEGSRHRTQGYEAKAIRGLRL